MFALLVAPGIASAATITVSATTDDNTTNGTCTLREAVIEANANNQSASTDCVYDTTTAFGADTINLTAQVTLDQAGEDDTSAGGDLDVTDPLTINGTDIATSGVRVNITGDDQRVIDIPEGDDLTLTGVNVESGRLDDSATSSFGGDIRMLNGADGPGDLAISDSRVAEGAITKSGSLARGGGIYINGHSLTLTNSNVQLNGAYGGSGIGGQGGGIYADGATDVTLNDTAVGMNDAGLDAGGAAIGNGGGIDFGSSGTLSINSGSVVSSNHAGGGSSTGLGSAGGILVNSGTIRINDSQVNNNFAGGSGTGNAKGLGGGIRVEGTTADVVITNSQVDGNTAGANGSTGEGNGGGIWSISTLTINGGSSVNGNSAGDNPTGTDGPGTGGGIELDVGSSAALNLTNSEVSDNHTNGFGGGIEMESNGTMTISGSSITSNTNPGGAGGGIRRVPGATTTPADTISETTIGGNTAGPHPFGRGGGLEAETHGSLTISASTIDLNQATGNSGTTSVGGGLSLNSSEAASNATGTYTIVNSTIDGNTATGFGGDGGNAGGVGFGVINTAFPPNATVIASTIIGNSAVSQALGGGTGGNVLANSNGSAGGNAHIAGSIVSDGSGDAGAENCASVSPVILVSDGGNVEGPPSTSLASQCSDTADDPTDAIGVDPMLDLPAFNGGSTETRRLLTGSPAINRVPPSICVTPPPTPVPLAVDQRGYPRPASDSPNCDSGAYELFICEGTLLNGPGPFPGCGAPVQGGGTTVSTAPPVTPNPLCAPLRKKLKKAKKAEKEAKVRKLRRKLRRLSC